MGFRALSRTFRVLVLAYSLSAVNPPELYSNSYGFSSWKFRYNVECYDLVEHKFQRFSSVLKGSLHFSIHLKGLVVLRTFLIN